MKENYTDEAIKLAMQGRWEEAAELNRRIIELAPEDIGAYNRLGKALTELGRYAEAREAYSKVLELDPNNSIARKNLERISHLEREGEPVPGGRRIMPQIFVEETTKAKVVDLHNPAPHEVLARVATGEEVCLKIQGHKLIVTTSSGEYLGEVEPRIGTRLIELLKGGNEYQAAIASLRDGQAKVIIRETFQHPSLRGYPSFLPQVEEEIRPYLRGSLLEEESEDIAEEEASEWEEDMDSLMDEFEATPVRPLIQEDSGGREMQCLSEP